MADRSSITVELTVHEARALTNMAGLFGSAFEGLAEEVGDVDPWPPPLVTGQMKLETALTIAGAEL